MKISFNPITDRHSLWGIANKSLKSLIGTTLLFFCVAPASWATEHIITIYFGGTSLPVTAWRADAETPWGKLVNEYGSPSLVASLHRHQGVWDSRHHKIYVPGVGAPRSAGDGGRPDHCETRLDAFEQKTFPHLLVCRPWWLTVGEALLNFDSKVRFDLVGWEDGDTITLNVVGHSRGAIAAMWFLNLGMVPGGDYGYLFYLHDRNILTKIHLIVLDPVPGIGMLADDDPAIGRGGYADVNDIGWDKFRLGSWLTKFVAIYAADERSNKFSALFPFLHNETETLIFSVRGGHQTMVGNLWKGGHAPVNFPTDCFLSSCNREDKYLPLQVINDVVALTVVELFKSPEWGELNYKKDFDFENLLLHNPLNTAFPYQDREMAFKGKVSSMSNVAALQTYYSWTQSASYFGWVPIVGAPLESWDGNSCDRMEDSGDVYTRCMERVLGSGHARNGLLYMDEIPSLGSQLAASDAWKRIRVLGFGDDDGDGIANIDDNCPSKANPGQEDDDGDGIGNVCEQLLFDSGFEGGQ
jgi:hypothetical protein